MIQDTKYTSLSVKCLMEDLLPDIWTFSGVFSLRLSTIFFYKSPQTWVWTINQGLPFDSCWLNYPFVLYYDHILYCTVFPPCTSQPWASQCPRRFTHLQTLSPILMGFNRKKLSIHTTCHYSPYFMAIPRMIAVMLHKPRRSDTTRKPCNQSSS